MDPSARLAVINFVGLSPRILKQMPRLSQWAASRRISSFRPVFPAVTCSAQATYVTGLSPEEHGIPGNGWYSRAMSEVQFWKQSDKLVSGEKIWESLHRLKGKDHTTAKLFWWYNMYSDIDWSITPRPMYPADGRKIFDIYTQPMGLREEIKKALGPFPFPRFWGPGSNCESSEWISRSAQWIEETYQPTLNLIYIPHLDYDLQRYGSNSADALPAIHEAEDLVMSLIEFFEGKESVVPIVLSEYGISPVTHDIALNRLFRSKGWITVKNELGKELLDCGASRVFAIADHQVAHIYLNDASLKDEVVTLLKSTDGIADVRLSADLASRPYPVQDRFGDIVAVANSDAWFSYYYWEDDSKAPDFARCVDIHRKPGYDPAELFIDPQLRFPALSVATFLLKKKIGLRALLELTPLHGRQVKGSHGSDLVSEEDYPVFIGPRELPDVHSGVDVYRALMTALGLNQ
jgi:predicted AlkP superfamily pyrophosphatase or phosphodiesterase